MRVGLGWSRHSRQDFDQADVQNKKLILRRLVQFSILDALQGAAGIQIDGKGAEGSLLKETGNQLHYSGFSIENIDATLMGCDEDLRENQRQLRSDICRDLFIYPEQFALKCSTYQSYVKGPHGQWLECLVVVNLQKRNQ